MWPGPISVAWTHATIRGLPRTAPEVTRQGHFSRQDLGINLNWIFKFCSSLSLVSALKCRHRKSFLEVQNIKNKHKNQFKTENLRNLGVTHNKKEVYLELETLTRWQRDSAQNKHFYFNVEEMACAPSSERLLVATLGNALVAPKTRYRKFFSPDLRTYDGDEFSFINGG